MRLGWLCAAAIAIAACSSDEPAPQKTRTRAATAAPALPAPVIGTRVHEDGVLVPTQEIEAGGGLYIGCDLDISRIEESTEVTLVWIFWPEKFTEPAEVLHQAWYRGGKREPARASVDQKSLGPVGAYECLWSIDHHGVSSRLYVRKP